METKKILEEIIADCAPEKFILFFRRSTDEKFAEEKELSALVRFSDADFANARKLGEIRFSPDEILLVALFQVTKELSERAGKKAQYEKARRVLKETQMSAGIFIFYDTHGNFRFSLVYPEATGRTRQWNNFRRFTYFVSKEFTNKTFLERIGGGDFSTLEKVKEAFSVEKVTKEFFDQYKKLFEKLLEYFQNDMAFLLFSQNHGVQLDIFAKKILGQIVFIYFLQKKGWLGAKKGEHISKGDKNYIRNLFAKSASRNENFFNEYLEYLFYDCLNKPPKLAGSFYREKFDCQIPFLNGGLFEPINEYDWEKEYLSVSDELFSNNKKDGILDIFDIYNFTIDENTIDDQEVSVDPEMLGKVFENLLPENIRKGKGAFYTPREIVHYMCEESLVNYLNGKTETETKEILFGENTETSKEIAEKIDSALKNIKIADPACGSGAFLVGMLQLIVKSRAKMAEITGEKISDYEFKKQTIENCIYGVDIDPGAVDIAKLRFWLSIVVDEDIDTIEPLPNLDYKIMQGNSLLEDLVVGDSVIAFKFDGGKKNDGRTKEMRDLFTEEKQSKLFVTDKSETLAESLEKLHTEYFKASEPEKKKILKRKIDAIEDELIQTKCAEEIKGLNAVIDSHPMDGKKLVENGAKITAIREVLEKWKKDHIRPFFPWKLHFSEVFGDNGGFDVVIGNPPYIKEYTNKNAFDGLRDTPHYQGKTDLWSIFTGVSIDHLKNGGTLSFIGPNNWATNAGSSILRNKIIVETEIKTFVDFGDFKVFESAGIQTMILILNKSTPKEKYLVEYLKIANKSEKEETVYTKMNGAKMKVEITSSKIKDKTLTFSTSEFSSVLDKIQKKQNFKLAETEVAQGIVAAPDKYFLETDLNLYLDMEKEFLKNYYTASGKYLSGVSRNFIFYISDKNFNSNEINEYPNIKNHFEPFKKELEEAKKKYGTSDKPYFYLHRERDEKFFEKGEKIICGIRVKEPSFYYTEDEYYGSRALNFIRTNRINLKYLTGILNSKLTFFWLKNKGKQLGDLLQVDKGPLLEIPIFVGVGEKQKEIESLVTQILARKYADPKADTSAIESEIDRLVYQLYDLTPEEIEIVENSGKR